MVALRLVALLLATLLAVSASADVFPYEEVGVGGNNSITDSNALSCDPVQGCYTRTGTPCSANPGQFCDLAIVPAGRCTWGDLTLPVGTNCTWPHGGGRCNSNIEVACVTDAYKANPANVANGPSSMCSGLATNTCIMTTDVFGGPFRTACECQGDNPAAPKWEQTVCGGSISVCSDGDPDRDIGGFGTALGTEINTGLTPKSNAALGPVTVGSVLPASTPYFGIENPPSSFDPQRSPGSLGAGNTGAVVRPRTTTARQLMDFLPALGIRKMVSEGDSYWNDFAFATIQTTGTFDTHIVVFSCDPPTGWSPDRALFPGPNPGVGDPSDQVPPFDPASKWCHHVGRDGVLFLWDRDLTAGELSGQLCPPNCKKDFDTQTVEIEAWVAAGLADPDAGAQLAIQDGVGRQAGAKDAIGVAVVTSITWLDNTGANGDLRCKMGGWGNTGGANSIGRCVDGPNECIPNGFAGANEATACATQGLSCRVCNGPLDPSVVANPNAQNLMPNNKALPPAYNPYGLPELNLIAGERIGGITGFNGAVRVPLFVIGTTGYAGAEFRDVAGEGGATRDLNDLGAVSTVPGLTVGTGTGGTFTNGTTLAIGEGCCVSFPQGVVSPTISWVAPGVGTASGATSFPWGPFLRTYDVGPGPNGIPGCIGDNEAGTGGLGADACRQRLGQGAIGDKTNGAFNTGQDDIPVTFPFPGGAIPASTNRFPWRNATAAVVTNYTGRGYVNPNPPTVSTIAAFPFRDINITLPRSTDIMVKVSTTACPLIGNVPQCNPVGIIDTDGDTVADGSDNCPTVANTPQTDGDVDLVGDACDNCTARPNARVAAGYLTTNPWATLTGGQRDDDHDGFGNHCDANFIGPDNEAVGPLDLAQYRSASGKSRQLDICGTGTAGTTRPCAIFDLNEIDDAIGPTDLARYRQLSGSPPGPKCAACTGTGSVPLPCTAGASGTCN